MPTPPKITKQMLNDPAHISPEIKKLQKKLVKALKETRSRSMNDLLLYMNVNEFERMTLMNNFDVLLKAALEQMKQEMHRGIDGVFLVAYYYYSLMYRQSIMVYKVPVPDLEPYPPIPPIVQPIRVDEDIRKVYQERTTALLDGVHNDLMTSVKETLTKGRIENWDDKEMKKALDRHFERAEIQAMRIARTEMQYAYNAYIVNEARKAGVNYLTWVTQADEFVCGECRPRHMKSYPIDNLPECPAHPNCRCSWVIPRE